jgi:hypothetical protein
MGLPAAAAAAGEAAQDEAFRGDKALSRAFDFVKRVEERV